MERGAAHRHGWVLAVHGGAGDRIPDLPPARLEAAGRALEVALRAGADELGQGGSALQAVVSAVKTLEDSPEFNAGRGAVLTRDGTVETDAAVADGHLRRAGGVAVCRRVRNPVEAARAVMERTDHVLLMGDAVLELAERCGLAIEQPDWFIVEDAGAQPDETGSPTRPEVGETVGAVARDMDGHLAAATSTGGRAGQLPGRVGDSAVVGAGVWADDSTGAVSATGHGETFLLTAFAHEVDALMRLSGLDIGNACERALHTVSRRGASGGCIAVDPAGMVVMRFTTAGMYRGWTDISGELRIEMLGHS